MPKPNYSFEKRQREIAKKKQKDEKKAKKAARDTQKSDTDELSVEGEPSVEGETPDHDA